MCFYIRNNIESATLWVAKQDVTCYKLLDGNLVSPYRAFQYKYNKLYKAKIGRLERVIYTNAVNSKSEIILDDLRDNNHNIFSINKGLHSYSSLAAASWGAAVIRYGCCVFKTIIPKGSEFYYDNINKEYISNQLIIKKLIK